MWRLLLTRDLYAVARLPRCVMFAAFDSFVWQLRPDTEWPVGDVWHSALFV